MERELAFLKSEGVLLQKIKAEVKKKHLLEQNRDREPSRRGPFERGHLRCGLVGLEQQSSSGLQESPQLDLVVPADGELHTAQCNDLIDGMTSQQVVLQFLCKRRYTLASLQQLSSPSSIRAMV